MRRNSNLYFSFLATTLLILLTDNEVLFFVDILNLIAEMIVNLFFAHFAFIFFHILFII